jgi:hypothetical protein
MPVGGGRPKYLIFVAFPHGYQRNHDLATPSDLERNETGPFCRWVDDSQSDDTSMSGRPPST